MDRELRTVDPKTMGTFHDGMDVLHGITVVVETTGTKTYVGRCWNRDETGIVLLDADVHEEGQDPGTRAEYVRRAYEFGVWKKHDRVAVDAAVIARVAPLGAWKSA